MPPLSVWNLFAFPLHSGWPLFTFTWRKHSIPCAPCSMVIYDYAWFGVEFSSNDGYMSIRNGSQNNGRRWPVKMNHIFLYITRMTGSMRIAYLGNTCHQDSLTEEDKPEQTLWQVKLNIGQCSRFLLGNVESCHPCACYFETYHLSKNWCTPCAG